MDYYNKYLKYKNKYYNIIKGGTATPGPFDIKEEYYPLSTNSFLYKADKKTQSDDMEQNKIVALEALIIADTIHDFCDSRGVVSTTDIMGKELLEKLGDDFTKASDNLDFKKSLVSNTTGEKISQFEKKVEEKFIEANNNNYMNLFNEENMETIILDNNDNTVHIDNINSNVDNISILRIQIDENIRINIEDNILNVTTKANIDKLKILIRNFFGMDADLPYAISVDSAPSLILHIINYNGTGPTNKIKKGPNTPKINSKIQYNTLHTAPVLGDSASVYDKIEAYREKKGEEDVMIFPYGFHSNEIDTSDTTQKIKVYEFLSNYFTRDKYRFFYILDPSIQSDYIFHKNNRAIFWFSIIPIQSCLNNTDMVSDDKKTTKIDLNWADIQEYSAKFKKDIKKGTGVKNLSRYYFKKKIEVLDNDPTGSTNFEKNELDINKIINKLLIKETALNDDDKITLIAKIIADYKRAGDYEQVNSASLIRTHYSDKINTIFTTGDRLCSLYARVNKLNTVKFVPGQNPYTMYLYKGKSIPVKPYQFLENYRKTLENISNTLENSNNSTQQGEVNNLKHFYKKIKDDGDAITIDTSKTQINYDNLFGDFLSIDINSVYNKALGKIYDLMASGSGDFSVTSKLKKYKFNKLDEGSEEVELGKGLIAEIANRKFINFFDTTIKYATMFIVYMVFTKIKKLKETLSTTSDENTEKNTLKFDSEPQYNDGEEANEDFKNLKTELNNILKKYKKAVERVNFIIKITDNNKRKIDEYVEDPSVLELIKSYHAIISGYYKRNDSFNKKLQHEHFLININHYFRNDLTDEIKKDKLMNFFEKNEKDNPSPPENLILNIIKPMNITNFIRIFQKYIKIFDDRLSKDIDELELFVLHKRNNDNDKNRGASGDKALTFYDYVKKLDPSFIIEDSKKLDPSSVPGNKSRVIHVKNKNIYSYDSDDPNVKMAALLVIGKLDVDGNLISYSTNGTSYFLPGIEIFENEERGAVKSSYSIVNKSFSELFGLDPHPDIELFKDLFNPDYLMAGGNNRYLESKNLQIDFLNSPNQMIGGDTIRALECHNALKDYLFNDYLVHEIIDHTDSPYNYLLDQVNWRNNDNINTKFKEMIDEIYVYELDFNYEDNKPSNIYYKVIRQLLEDNFNYAVSRVDEYTRLSVRDTVIRNENDEIIYQIPYQIYLLFLLFEIDNNNKESYKVLFDSYEKNADEAFKEKNHKNFKNEVDYIAVKNLLTRFDDDTDKTRIKIFSIIFITIIALIWSHNKDDKFLEYFYIENLYRINKEDTINLCDMITSVFIAHKELVNNILDILDINPTQEPSFYSNGNLFENLKRKFNEIS